MVYRVYVEKKDEFANEAKSLKNDLKEFLQISNLENLRMLNRYDVENIDSDLFEYCKQTVFSEPQLDIVTSNLPEGNAVFAVEFLPGQFDQRAASAAECIQIISKKEKPVVRTAKVYVLTGNLSSEEIEKIKKYIINPVESQEAVLEEYETLSTVYEEPADVEIMEGFINLDENGLGEFIKKYSLAMDLGDIKYCQEYFKTENRNPSLTEIKMIDTYWSDHCRHTTFLTTIDSVKFEDELLEKAYNEYLKTREEIGRTKPVNLMDVATIAVKYLKKNGKLNKLDESEEINACTVKIKVEVDGNLEDWLLLFKNETHNHPTEIEPFGGAATCIGGAIRDPLSGRSYVYHAMRVTGAANPLAPINETIKGKLPQRKIVTTAAAGYSSYGNQIGLATGQVDEIYHPGYMAKRMEVGAVVAAAPERNVVRKRPEAGDIVILLGGKTGRDGCGGATGSSKSHNLQSLEQCGAEVQKGNAPEERKLQRLFRNEEASRLIKRCNDFGAGGVSVAIGELADGLEINLDAVPKKYDGLNGTELAISESQERMAVVVAKENVERFVELSKKENLEATVVAEVTENPRLRMSWRGKYIVDISREFLDSNGAEKHIDVVLEKPEKYGKEIGNNFVEEYKKLAGDLNVCSRQGLSERFDSTIGAGTVLAPFGGKMQKTPIQAMVSKVSHPETYSKTCSLMSYAFNPYISEKSPYHGSYLAVVEAICKLVSTGAKFEDVYLSFQEYFERLNKDSKKWGKPLAALLGALKAQKDFEVGAIGGKDSMSGSFENIHVPPTLISFAVTTEDVDHIVSPEFKMPNHKVVLLKPEYDENGLPVAESVKAIFKQIEELNEKSELAAAYTVGFGGIAEAVMKMCFGNNIGFKYSDVSLKDLFEYCYGGFVLELNSNKEIGITLGETTQNAEIIYKNDKLELVELLNIYENKLESVYPLNIKQEQKDIPNIKYETETRLKSKIKVEKPKVLIPVFPGTNCEYDTARAFAKVGAEPKVFVINNLTSEGISNSIKEFAEELKTSQIVFIPGGFSGGDEPDGSAKFITAFFRNQEIKEAVTDLLENRDGLVGGICNGFQALVKLGLVPYGKIIDTDENCPTLTFNTIGRHQSKIVRTKLCSNKSPWLANAKVGEIYEVPISHGEGRFIGNEDVLKQLIENGQVATQYVDLEGNPTADIAFNPNNSMYAIEGITSPDGRVFGKMGHSERTGYGLYKNVPGNFDIEMFRAAVEYFK